MLIASQRIRVEWSHCDPAGIIFNPNYYIWMDHGGHALLAAAGFDFFAAIRDESEFLGCPLVASNMNFKRPIRYGDVIVLHSQVERFGNTSFVLKHEFWLGENCVADGNEVRVWGYRNELGALRAGPVPEHVKARLSVSKTVDMSV